MQTFFLSQHNFIFSGHVLHIGRFIYSFIKYLLHIYHVLCAVVDMGDIDRSEETRHNPCSHKA